MCFRPVSECEAMSWLKVNRSGRGGHTIEDAASLNLIEIGPDARSGSMGAPQFSGWRWWLGLKVAR